MRRYLIEIVTDSSPMIRADEELTAFQVGLLRADFSDETGVIVRQVIDRTDWLGDLYPTKD